MYYLGIDVGTSGCKALVTDIDGRMISSSGRNYALRHPAPGWMELDAEEVLTAVLDCIGECCRGGVGSRVSALAVSTQGEAVIPVDWAGHALDHAIVTFDIRNANECRWLAETADKADIMRKTGAPLHPMFSLTKILWHKRQNPAVFDAAWKFLCFGDFIAFRLGAEACIDYTMAARTMAFDIHTMKWSTRLLELCEIPVSKMPDAVPPGTVIGRVSADAAKATGLTMGTAIVAGGHDQACCALGAGVTDSGVAMDSLGTTESILCVYDRAVSNQFIQENNIPCCPYVLPDKYAYLAFLSCCGSVVEWCRSQLLGNRLSLRELDAAAAQAGRPTGLFWMPHFAGSGTPHLDFNSTGVITGLTLRTTHADLFRAALEGTAYEMRLNIDVLERCGISVNQYRCIGGGSKSDVWMQIKADVCGKPLTTMHVGEAGGYGAAMLAACGVHNETDAAALARLWAREGRTFEPRSAVHEQYTELFESYRRVYALSSAVQRQK